MTPTTIPNPAVPSLYKLSKYDGREGISSFRPMTRQEILALLPGCHVWFQSFASASGIVTARRAKLNGRVRTWKRDPSRIEVPLKYGLYEYFTLRSTDLARLLVEIC